jgi:hypothetical protein
MEMHMNWAAYAVAVVAQLIIGFLYFHPALLGKVWAKSINTTVEEMKPKNPGVVYGLTILYTLIFTFWLLINVTGPGQEDMRYHTFQHGIAHATLLTVMVVIPVLGTPALYENKSAKYMFVQFGYWFVRMAVAQGILSLWR